MTFRYNTYVIYIYTYMYHIYIYVWYIYIYHIYIYDIYIIHVYIYDTYTYIFIYIWYIYIYIYIWYMYIYIWYMYIYIYDTCVYIYIYDTWWYMYIYIWYMYIYIWYMYDIYICIKHNLYLKPYPHIHDLWYIFQVPGPPHPWSWYPSPSVVCEVWRCHGTPFPRCGVGGQVGEVEYEVGINNKRWMNMKKIS